MLYIQEEEKNRFERVVSRVPIFIGVLYYIYKVYIFPISLQQ